MEAREFIRRNSCALLVLLVFTLYFVTRLAGLRSMPVFIDEAIYVRWAREAAGGNLWASLLWDGKPPLHAWAMAPFLSMAGDPLLAARLSSVFFGFLGMTGLGLLGREIGGPRLGVMAAFLYTACPYCLLYDRVAIAESLLLALSVFAVYFTVKAAVSGRYRHLLGSSVATGLALLTKGTAMLLYPVVFLAYLCRAPLGPGGRRGAPASRHRAVGRDLGAWAGSAAACLLLAFGILNVLRLSPVYPERSRFISTRSKGALQALSTSPGEMLRFDLSIASSLLEFLTPALLLLGIAGFLLALRRGWRPGAFLAAWFLAQWLIISVVARFPWPRFYLVLVPPLLLSAGYCVLELAAGLGSLFREGRRARARAASIALCAVAAGVLVGVGPLSLAMIQARAGEESFLSGRTCGAGLKECVEYLEREAGGGGVTVVVNDYFLRLAVEMYSRGDRGLQVVSLDNEFRAGASRRFMDAVEEAAGRGTTYALANNVRGIPDGWRVRVLREFRKDRGNRRASLVLARAWSAERAAGERTGPPP